MPCVFLEYCPIYREKLSVDRGIGAILRKRYCEGNHLNCARYLTASTLGPEFVPPTLFPNMMDIAEKLIAEEKDKQS